MDMSDYTDDYIDHMVDGWFDDPPYHHITKTKKKGNSMKLVVGDRVRLGFGTRPLIVESVYGNDKVSARYEHSGGMISYRHMSEFVRIDGNNEQKGNTTMKGKLFQTKEPNPRFGIGLAINSTGKYVLEMKGSGDLEAFDKREVEVVMPFTFSVKFNGQGTEYSYLGKEGSVSVGDLLLKTDDTKGITIAKVVAVDTKSEKATKYFEGVKLATTPLDQ
jgi:hypothetical protein